SICPDYPWIERLLGSSPAVEKEQLLEQVDILFVLQQRPMQRRNRLSGILGAQRLRRNVLCQEQLDPVEQFRSRRLLFQARDVPDPVESLQRFAEQIFLQPRKMHIDDLLHRLLVRETDVVEETAPQERIGKLLLVVARYDDDRPVACLYELLRLIDKELHPVQLLQQIIREFDV